MRQRNPFGQRPGFRRTKIDNNLFYLLLRVLKTNCLGATSEEIFSITLQKRIG